MKAPVARTDLELEFTDATLKWVERELELTEAEMGQALGVDRKTIYRWRNHVSVPAPEQRRQMEKFAQLKWFLDHSFRTPAHGKKWLYQSVPALKGRLPISVVTEGDVDSVLGVLATHASGAHV